MKKYTMAYYRKKEVENIITKANEALKKCDVNSLTPIEESLMQLKNEEDVVIFSWLLIDNEIEFQTKSFARLTSDLYTDDRYVLDAYAASKEGKLVTDFIEEKLKSKEVNTRKEEIAAELKKRIEEKKK